MGGSLVISLDFELAWGMLGVEHQDGRYRQNLEGVWDVVPGTLELFERYGIHATWATVGMLTFNGAEAWREAWPAVRPRGIASTIDPYRVTPDASASPGSVWFAPELIDAIVGTPNQELASHGFAHLPCLEGMDRAAFKADLAAASAAFKPWGVTPQSYVWPKHQLRREWLSDLREEGFIAHRGPAHHRLYMPRPGRAGGVHVRAGRLVDAIVPISGDGAHAWPPADMSNHPLDVPESHFVRPLPRPLVATARSLQTVRLQDAMTHAAKLGRMLHLWWHPHNFGDDPKGHLRHLERLLQHFQALGQAWDFPSLTMLGAAEAAWDLEDVDHARASASSYTASYRPSTSVSP